MVRRTWDWLAEQPEDAAELALLLFEAAPKLNFSETGPSRQASCKIPRRASYKEQGGFKRRLGRAVPMPSGEGWILGFQFRPKQTQQTQGELVHFNICANQVFKSVLQSLEQGLLLGAGRLQAAPGARCDHALRSSR